MQSFYLFPRIDEDDCGFHIVTVAAWRVVLIDFWGNVNQQEVNKRRIDIGNLASDE